MPCQQIDDGGGHEKGRNAARAALGVIGAGFLDHGQAADTGADDAGNALGLRLIQRLARGQARIGHGFGGGNQAVLDEGVHRFGFLGGNHGGHIQPLDFARNAAGKSRCIKTGDGGDAALACQQAGPALADVVADGADAAQAGDDNAATVLAHLVLLHKIKGPTAKLPQTGAGLSAGVALQAAAWTGRSWSAGQRAC